jgi:hypothetical protein
MPRFVMEHAGFSRKTAACHRDCRVFKECRGLSWSALDLSRSPRFIMEQAGFRRMPRFVMEHAGFSSNVVYCHKAGCVFVQRWVFEYCNGF